MALTVLVLGTTIGLYLVFSQAPRGAFSLSIVFFLCLIEVGVGLASVASLAAPGRGQASGAGRAILLGALGTYAVLGLATIAVRASLDSAGTLSDSKYLAILFAEGVACFTVAALVLGHDAFGGSDEDLAAESVELRDRFLALLATLATALDDFKPQAQEDRLRVERLRKDLQALRTTVAHSPLPVGVALAQQAMTGGSLPKAARGVEGPADLEALERTLRQLQDSTRTA